MEKYNARAKKVNSLLCVGLDADITKIPERFLKMEHPQYEFNKWIINETHVYTAAYKPNSAFYEARGDQGIKELKMTIEYLQKNYPDIFTILDSKRADIGNTNNGYAESTFDWFGFDAVTLNPYLGFEAISPFIGRKDKVSIILCRTSNPGSGEFQELNIDNKPLWQIVAEHSKAINENSNNLMLVTGATYPNEIIKLREVCGEMTFLVPGVGAQGAVLSDFIPQGLNKNKLGLIINSGRAIIFNDNPRLAAENTKNEINKLII
ncbi:MAG: orotidine-5'-phosphate decarboxylase [Patescibacteria group bacterium]